MANVFNSVKGLHPKRNAFSAHTYRNDFTGRLGLDIPVYQQHVTAATRVKVNAATLVRLQALICPIMDNIDYYCHFWKIPYRLLENDRFTQFISGEIAPEDYEGYFVTGNDFAQYLLSAINEQATWNFNKREACYMAIVGYGGLLDYLGYDTSFFPTGLKHAQGSQVAQFVNPNGGNKSTQINFRPLIAYYMLHLHWYMNENVPYFNGFDGYVKSIVETPDAWGELCALLVFSYNLSGSSLLPHGWEKDYFTSALPNVQFGEAVTIGITGNAPLTTGDGYVSLDVIPNQAEIANDMLIGLHQNGGTVEILRYTLRNQDNIGQVYYDAGDTNQYQLDHGSKISGTFVGTSSGQAALHIVMNDQTMEGIYADLSEASAISINELRFANALQVFKEREQRFGRRRMEYYKGFFDVTPEDLRLQVPQYLGGGRVPINISDIEQTSETSETQALGRLAGKATAVAGSFAGFNTFCSEESVIIGIAFAMPHITYAQTCSKFLMKTNDKYDYFNPSFEHLGEQAIKVAEIYPGADEPESEFGYTPRYNEYRFHANEMHGQFKSTLAYWTLGRIFQEDPALNAEFVYMQPSVFDRIFAVEGQDNMLVSMIFHTQLIQPVSKYGTPRIMV